MQGLCWYRKSKVAEGQNSSLINNKLTRRAETSNNIPRSFLFLILTMALIRIDSDYTSMCRSEFSANVLFAFTKTTFNIKKIRGAIVLKNTVSDVLFNLN